MDPLPFGEGRLGDHSEGLIAPIHHHSEGTVTQMTSEMMT